MNLKDLTVTGWTNWENERYPDGRDLLCKTYDDVITIKQIVADELKAKGYKFSGYEHQNCINGTPILSNQFKFTFSLREWGDIMAMAYNEDHKDDPYAYVEWAWAPHSIVHEDGTVEEEEIVMPQTVEYPGKQE